MVVKDDTRTMSAHDFTELYRASIIGGKRFDDIVDSLVHEHMATKTPNVDVIGAALSRPVDGMVRG